MGEDSYDDQGKESEATQNVDKKKRQQTTHHGISSAT
jgi:hypothetical protein